MLNVYAGDSQALPGYVSVYLQLSDPGNSNKWDVFASYRLSLTTTAPSAMQREPLARDSWHRFSARKKSHGGCTELGREMHEGGHVPGISPRIRPYVARKDSL